MDRNLETGVTFILEDGTQVHTYHDLCIRQLARVDIAPPTAKRHIIENVPGINGYLDMTKSFGPIRYDNREVVVAFEMQDMSYDEWMGKCTEVVNTLHSRYVRMIMDIDPEYYMEGYVTCTPTKEALIYSEMEITIDAFPYKVRNEKYRMMSATGENVVRCDRMPTVPTFTSNVPFSVTYEGNVYSYGTGENEAEFEITEGDNILTFSVSGVIIEWDGGCF